MQLNVTITLKNIYEIKLKKNRDENREHFVSQIFFIKVICIACFQEAEKI